MSKIVSLNPELNRWEQMAYKIASRLMTYGKGVTVQQTVKSYGSAFRQLEQECSLGLMAHTAKKAFELGVPLETVNTLADSILHDFLGFPKSEMPAELRARVDGVIKNAQSKASEPSVPVQT